MRPTALTPVLLAALVAQACSCDDVPSSAVTNCKQAVVVQGAVKTDILFVIDDSLSMAPKQANLQNNLAAFINALQTSPVANDFQIGVTTTSVSDFNGLPYRPAGKLVGAPKILSGADANLVANFQGTITGISALTIQGAGSPKEQPFRAMRLALSAPLVDTDNAGFLRPGARLAVIFLSDEDDNSESNSNVVQSDPQSHNDDGTGVDYKHTVEDPIADYVAFLKGPIGGEVRDVVLGAIVGIDPNTKLPTCGYDAVTTGKNGWCCGSPADNTCQAAMCGSNDVANPAAAPNLRMPVYCCGAATGSTCTSGCPTAYDKADRFMSLLDGFPWNRTFAGAVCDASFERTLQQIAGVIASPTVPISGEPADPRLLLVRLQQPNGALVTCTLGTDYAYAPASGIRPATLTFLESGACRLQPGDTIHVDVICAG